MHDSASHTFRPCYINALGIHLDKNACGKNMLKRYRLSVLFSPSQIDNMQQKHTDTHVYVYMYTFCLKIPLPTLFCACLPSYWLLNSSLAMLSLASEACNPDPSCCYARDHENKKTYHTIINPTILLRSAPVSPLPDPIGRR